MGLMYYPPDAGNSFVADYADVNLNAWAYHVLTRADIKNDNMGMWKVGNTRRRD